MKNITVEWLKAANDDLLLIEKILTEASLTHMVAFHAQQVIEKCLKAISEEKQIELLKIHNLKTLFAKINEPSFINLNSDMVNLLDSLYIESRYPGDRGLLPDGKPSLADAQEFYEFAKHIYNKTFKILTT